MGVICLKLIGAKRTNCIIVILYPRGFKRRGEGEGNDKEEEREYKRSIDEGGKKEEDWDNRDL